MDEIKPNTCPYCGAPYGLTWGGCRDACTAMARQYQYIREASVAAETIDADELEAYARSSRPRTRSI